MDSVYRIGEFAEKIGCSASTVRRWESEGRVSSRRSPYGQRFFSDADVHAVLTPVSAAPIVGGGMDLTRPKLLALMADVKAGKVGGPA